MSTNELKNTVDKDGKAISPILKDNIMNYLIDIDGTITEDVPNEEPERMLTCEPYEDALEILDNITLESSAYQEMFEHTYGMALSLN